MTEVKIRLLIACAKIEKSVKANLIILVRKRENEFKLIETDMLTLKSKYKAKN